MSGAVFIGIVIGCTAILVAVCSYNKFRQSYWKRRNVPGPEPVLIFGNFKEQVLRKSSIHERFRDLYLAWRHEPFVGLYELIYPSLLVNDPELIQRILIKDFTSFPNHGFPVNEDVDPLSANLLELEDHRWKQLRQKLSPLFTSGKLKQMYHILNECADVFEIYIEELVAKGEPIEVKEVSAKFTTDVIGSCAFGLNLNALSSKESEFFKIGHKWFAPTFVNFFKHFMRSVFPVMFKLFKIKMTSEEDTKFFISSITETIAYRKKNGVIRHDFIDLMTELQGNPDGMSFELTDELLAAQAYIFFMAGLETSSTAMTYALYELALHPEIQDKLHDEIQEALKTHDGRLPYEATEKLKYLDKVYKETLRKNPPAATLGRTAARDYTIPGSQIEIPVGMRVIISVLGLHHNPQYYPNPEVFDPERFSEEAIRQRPKMVYLPFGDGPRNCIGARFARYQTKMGLIRILKKYRVTMSPKTEIPYRLSNFPVILRPSNGIYLNFITKMF